MSKYFLFVPLTGHALLQPSLIAQHVSVRPTHLITDNRDKPMGVSADPVFGWNLEATGSGARGGTQSGYRVRLATSQANLHQPTSVLWDSGRIASSTYWQRPYSGPPLASPQTYFWQVQSWAAGGSAGPWSPIASFTTGLLRQEVAGSLDRRGTRSCAGHRYNSAVARRSTAAARLPQEDHAAQACHQGVAVRLRSGPV